MWFTDYRLRIDGLQKFHQLSFVSGKQFQTAAKFSFTALAKFLFCLWGESSERLSQLTDLFSDVPASLPWVADGFEFQQKITAAKGVGQRDHPGREVVATLEAADEPIGSGPRDFGQPAIRGLSRAHVLYWHFPPKKPLGLFMMSIFPRVKVRGRNAVRI